MPDRSLAWELVYKNDSLRKRITELEADNGRLRKALKQIIAIEDTFCTHCQGEGKMCGQIMAVVEAAKNLANNSYDLKPSVMELKNALADLEGGGGE